MKKLFAVLVMLVLVAGFANSQVVVSDRLYRVPLVLNETDTIPGTHSGGAGAGFVGWINVGSYDVEYSMTCQDSMNAYVAIDYADTGFASETAANGKDVGFKTFTRPAAEDSLVAITNVAAPKAMISRTIRSQIVDNIPGARWIRFRVTVPNTASKLAATAAGATVSLRVRTIKR